jgi:hypothetical protein
VGAPAANLDNCHPNVNIVFTSHPQQFMDDVARNRPKVLGYHYVAQRRRMATFSRGIQSWYMTASRDSNGAPSLDSTTGGAIVAASAQSASWIYSRYTSEFAHVLVVVDADMLGDYPLKAVTDYVALLTLTRTKALDGCNQLPSILDLLSATCGERARPPTITAADTAYLKGLYSSELNKFQNLEKAEIHDRMLTGVSRR